MSKEIGIGSKVSFRPNWKVPVMTGKVTDIDGQFLVIMSEDGKVRKARKGSCTLV